MITSELVQAPGFLDVGERPIASPADAAITLTDATLNVLPSVSFVPSLTLPSALAMAGTPAGGKRYRFRDANGSAATYNITINAPGTRIRLYPCRWRNRELPRPPRRLGVHRE